MIARVAKTSARSADNLSVTTGSIDTTGANLIVLAVSTNAGATPTDSKGNTWTALTQRTASSLFVRLWYSLNPTVGSGHTFTLNPAGGSPAIAVAAYSGVKIASAFDVENGAGSAGSSTLATGSVTPSEDNELLITAVAEGGTTFAVDAGFTIIESAATNATSWGIGLAELIQTTASAKNPTWDQSPAGGQIAVAIATFKVAGFHQSISGSITPVGALVKRTNKGPVGAITPTGALSKQLSRALAAAVTPVGTLLKQAQRRLTAAIASSGALTPLKITLKSLAGSITPAGAITQRTIARRLIAAIAPVGAIVKRLARTLTAAITPSSSVAGRIITESTVFVHVGGVERTSNVRHGSLEIEDVLNDAPNRATFTAVDWVPSEGAVVVVTRGLTAELEFAGHILRVEQFYESIPANVAYHVTCQDYTWKLNRRRVTKRWTNTSASTIATEIITGSTTGFTTTNIVPGLATITEFECVLEEPSRALSRLCAEFGGNWYVDYELDVHVFVTESVDTPEDISDATLAATTARGLAHTGDLSQAKTRVTALGAGTAALEHRPPSATDVPLQLSTIFNPAGGSAASGPNLMTYTGKHDGGLAATVVGNTAAPSGALSAAVNASGVGVLEGVYKYKVAFANESGETAAGPESSTVTGVAHTVPGAASLAAGSTIGRLIGGYSYKLTNVTALGETTGGTNFARTASATSAPSAPSVAVVDTGVNTDIGKLIGAYGYKVSLVSAFGESAASSAGSRTAVAQTAPSAPSVTNSTIGPLLGSYTYKVSFVGPDGKETIGSASSTYSPTATVATTPTASGTVGGGLKGRARVAWIHSVFGESEWSANDEYDGVAPITVTANSLPSGCSWVVFYTGAFTGGGEATAAYKRGSGIYTTTGAQNIDNETGVPVANAAGSMGKNGSLSSIAVGPTGTVSRRIYRTKNGGSTYFLVGEIGDNSTTTWNDIVPDSALTVLAPVQNLNGEQHTVSSIGTGPTGTTKRYIYRTEAGGSTYYFLREIPDNSTTSFVDNATDAELDKGRTAPSAGTMGDQHALTSIPTGPTGTLARNIYRTEAGGTSYKFLYQLTDNVTTTFTDNIPDASLGDFIPLVNTAGASKFDLSSIPTGGSGVTKRILYRTEAGGSVFKYVGTINDNSTSTFTDNVPDTSLGRVALTIGTLGALTGDTTLTGDDLTGWPTSGWVRAGSLLISFSGRTGNQLTGIPGERVTTITRSGTTATATTVGAHGFVTGQTVTVQGADQSPYNGAHKITVGSSTTYTFTVAGAPATPATGSITTIGPGGILSSIAGGTDLVTAPFISGVSGILWSIERGEQLRIMVTRSDAAAQAVLAALEGGDGIHDATIEDASIESDAGLTTAADAELTAYSTKMRSITFKSRDPLLRTGKTLTLDLGAPTNLSGDFLIQRVISTEFNTIEGEQPMRDVIAAPVLVSFQDVLRRARNDKAA